MFNAPNNTFANVNKEIYIARKGNVTYDDYNNEIITYEEPFYYGAKNYQPLTWKSLQAYKEVYGEVQSNVVQCLIDYSDENMFKEFDLAYLYGVTPKGETINGENANYVVKAFRKQNTRIMVIFEEIIKEVV